MLFYFHEETKVAGFAMDTHKLVCGVCLKRPVWIWIRGVFSAKKKNWKVHMFTLINCKINILFVCSEEKLHFALELYFEKELRTCFKEMLCLAEKFLACLHFSMNKCYSSFGADPVLFPSPTSSPLFCCLATVSKMNYDITTQGGDNPSYKKLF